MDVSLDIIAMKFGLESMASRRLYNDIAFVHKLINSKLSFLELDSLEGR